MKKGRAIHKKRRPTAKSGWVAGDHVVIVPGENDKLTVEDDSMSIQELFEKSAIRQGFQFEDAENEMDFDDIDLEEFRRLDAHEQHQIIDNHSELVREMKKAHKEEIAQKQKQAEVQENIDEASDEIEKKEE